MIWLTWRQFRPQAIVAAVALAVVATTLAVTGPRLAGLYASSGLAACQPHGDCGTLVNGFLAQAQAGVYKGLFNACAGLLLVVPGLIGVFWGAPLVTREFETGTYRLAWNQSVTRARWLAVKLGLIGLASMAVTGLLSLMVTWWASPIDRASALPAGRNGAPGLNRFAPVLFDSRGVVPIAYALFAFALGATAGVLIRRTVPAMAVTLAVFAAVQVMMPLWARPYLMAPLHVTSAFNPAKMDQFTTNDNGSYMAVTAAVDLPGAWVIANQSLTPAGRVFTGPAPAACMRSTNSMTPCQSALGRLGLRQYVTYQPASRYWAFQAYEAAIFVVLAAGLGACCAVVIRHRAG
jgi:ABC-2 family transporter